MKKRSLLLCLALVLSLTMAIGGTLAYLTETEYATNVMTLGNVDITIHDVQTNAATNKEEDFDQYQNLYPAVRDENGKMIGELEKIVYLENTGSSDAYVRTILAFPALGNRAVTLDENSPIVFEYASEIKKEDIQVVENVTLKDKDGVEKKYTLFVFTSDTKLAPGEKTEPSLLSFYMNPDVTNEDLKGFNGEYRIDVAAQAVQYTNFENMTAEEALNTAFHGDAELPISAANNPWNKDGLPALSIAHVVSNVEELKAALKDAEDGDSIGLYPGTYTVGETLNVDKAVSIMGVGSQPVILKNVVFDVDASSGNHDMAVTFENLTFEGESRIIVGNRTYHNGVGGPGVLPTTKLTVKNCTAETTFTNDPMKDKGGKGQFIYLAATYTVKLDLTLDGNTFVNAHSIENEDAAPVVNGNGTVIQNVTITNNTFGSAENPCDRYAVKFARRADGANITISNNTVYGATTADKDFYILDLWQSGSNVQNDLTVKLTNNTIHCTPNTNRTMYAAYIEASVKGENLTVTASGNTTDTLLNNATK